MFKQILLPAAAAAVLLSTPVFAQGNPPFPDNYQTAPRGDFGRAHRIQERLQRLHDRLGITPAQQPQWDAVVATLRENAQAMRGSPARQAIRSGQLNAVQDMHAFADLAHQRADAVQRMIPPVEALYAALSPQQRQTADQVLNRVMHHEHRHG
jgi:hypothetical protein